MTLAGRRYRDDITNNCGPCDCPPLAKLKGIFERVITLENACNRYVREGAVAHVDNPEDREFADPAFTQAYATTHAEWEQAKKVYQQTLPEYAAQGDMLFKLHDPEKQRIVRTMSYPEVQRELHITRNDLAPLITLNCAHCERYWGVAV